MFTQTMISKLLQFLLTPNGLNLQSSTKFSQIDSQSQLTLIQYRIGRIHAIGMSYHGVAVSLRAASYTGEIFRESKSI